MTVLAERAEIRKDADGMDVEAWNAANPLHPRSGDGRFSIAGMIARLVEGLGETLGHEEFGEPEHPFSHHGAVSAHPSGVSLSSLGEDGDTARIAANLSPDNASTLADNIELALDDLEKGGYGPGTHFDYDSGEGAEGDSYPLVSFGVMEDGTRYVALTSPDGENDIQLNAEHAERLAVALREQGALVAGEAEGDPYRVRPLPEGETLLRRRAVRGEVHDDLLIALVDTPSGRRLRLGLGGDESHPAKNFTGGRGPAVASLDEGQARTLLAEIDDVHSLGDAHLDEMEAANADYDQWLETPDGQELLSLTELKRKAPRPDSPITNAIYGRTGEPLTVEQEARLAELNEKAASFYEGLTEEGEYFAEGREVETEWGTVTVRGMAQSDGGFDVRISIRPKGSTAEQWEQSLNGYELPEADLGSDALANLYKLFGSAFAEKVSKSAGSATDTPGAGRARALKRYWTRGKGLAKWVRSAHPWTTLRRHLSKYIHDPDKLDRTTSAWFHAATGMWSGERKGRNPLGRG